MSAFFGGGGGVLGTVLFMEWKKIKVSGTFAERPKTGEAARASNIRAHQPHNPSPTPHPPHAR